MSQAEEKTGLCALVRGGVTDEEEVCLAELRRIKSEAAPVKARLAELKAKRGRSEAVDEEVEQCQCQLGQLRHQWQEWDRRRREANRAKWIALGYDP